MGQPIGGQSMARLTVEWTFPIIPQARGALFYDSGFVNSNPWSFGISALASDVGFGIRLNLPIGPMRLDYGYPLKRDGYNGGGHFNFSVGYQF
jgi:outer membrane protein insertion porin family